MWSLALKTLIIIISRKLETYIPVGLVEDVQKHDNNQQEINQGTTPLYVCCIYQANHHILGWEIQEGCYLQHWQREPMKGTVYPQPLDVGLLETVGMI